MPVYNWLRIILSIASIISFAPQIQRIVKKRSSADISLAYILLNTISATEQFALGFYLIATHNHDTDFFVSEPRNVGDWLNLAQLTIVWAMFLILFAICLWHAPSTSPKKRAIALYTSFLLISVIPLLIDFLIPVQDPEDEFWFSVIFSFVHTQLVNPVVTFGAVAALYYQWHNAGAAALSQDGLLIQAVVFAGVALSWTARVRFEPDGGEGYSGGPPESGFPVTLWLKAWYYLVGWAAVDNAVFSLVQAALFCKRRHETAAKSGGEEEPLLGP